MTTPLILILTFLSFASVLGLTLGWLLWKFGSASVDETEVAFWKQRLEQTRRDRDLKDDEISRMDQERETLKRKLEMSKEK